MIAASGSEKAVRKKAARLVAARPHYSAARRKAAVRGDQTE
jgi:hypothetical protein